MLTFISAFITAQFIERWQVCRTVYYVSFFSFLQLRVLFIPLIYFVSIKLRKLISDFSIFMSIMTFVGLDMLIGLKTPKLIVPTEFKVRVNEAQLACSGKWNWSWFFLWLFNKASFSQRCIGYFVFKSCSPRALTGVGLWCHSEKIRGGFTWQAPSLLSSLLSSSSWISRSVLSSSTARKIS